MNQQEILKKIGGIISELKDQHSFLETSANSFNALELELFMANANFLIDHIEILKKIHGQMPPAALPPAAPILPLEKAYGQRQKIPDFFSEEEQSVYVEDVTPVLIKSVAINESFESVVPETKEPEVTKSETILLPETMPQDEAGVSPLADDASFIEQKLVSAAEPEEAVVIGKVETISEEAVQTVNNILPSIQPELVAAIKEKKPETVKQEVVKPTPLKSEPEPVLTLNQQIAAQRGLDQSKTKAAEKHNKPVQDLQLLITLNDKLLFVKELFNGYNLAYAEAINILNRYTTFEQAENFLSLNYAIKNNWKEKPAATERFYEVLRKRFS